ncbi:MAG: hypothetical protein IT385_16015 [Deltaproteobacteria bacterium]|nr:hypothetical protein [Deltaproteobacteria bacterium]
MCRDPSCTDDVRNQGETAVDCGGTRCPGRDDGLGDSGLTCQKESVIERKGKYTSNGLSVGSCLR